MRKVTKIKPLKEPRIFFDRKVKMWVIVDSESGVATQAETISKLLDNFIEALRCMCAAYAELQQQWNRRAIREAKGKP
jgi:elongation factor P hydroxylase